MSLSLLARCLQCRSEYAFEVHPHNTIAQIVATLRGKHDAASGEGQYDAGPWVIELTDPAPSGVGASGFYLQGRGRFVSVGDTSLTEDENQEIESRTRRLG